MRKQFRVLHCPYSTGNSSWFLSRAERKMGIQSDLMISHGNLYENSCDINLNYDINASKIVNMIKLLKFFLFSLYKYDIYHFNTGTSLTMIQKKEIFWEIELFLLKLLRKKIFVTFQGCDGRQKTVCRENYDQCACFDDECTRACNVSAKQKKIRLFDKYAAGIYTTNPDLKRVLPERARFRPYTKLDINEIEQEYEFFANGKINIVHAPTNKGVKGSKYILGAFEQLQREYCDRIHIEIIENMPNDEAIKRYRKADILVDQLLIGWYGGIAVEVMAMGRPVVSYIREDDMKFIPDEMNKQMPIIRANKDNIFEVLKYFIENKDQLPAIGMAGRKYVEKWHNTDDIAKVIVQDYKNAYID